MTDNNVRDQATRHGIARKSRAVILRRVEGLSVWLRISRRGLNPGDAWPASTSCAGELLLEKALNLLRDRRDATHIPWPGYRQIR